MTLALTFYALALLLFLASAASLSDMHQALGLIGLATLCFACAYGYVDYWQTHSGKDTQ